MMEHNPQAAEPKLGRRAVLGLSALGLALGPQTSSAAANTLSKPKEPRGRRVRYSVVISDLRQRCRGDVLSPGDPAFEEACDTYLGGMQQRPNVVVRPADRDDVVTAVRVVSEHGAPTSVKGGGHSKFAIGDGGVLIDTSVLTDFELDQDSAMVWAGAGLTTGEFVRRAFKFGLGAGFGDTGSVGLAGILLGGGIGYLSRREGLALDHVTAFEIVTGDGTLRVVDEYSYPELFWALRGGGGNFGVVTRIKLKLRPMGEVTAGLIVLPATADVLTGFVAESMKAPRDLTNIMNVMPAPPMPFLDESLVGTTVAMIMAVHSGNPSAADSALAPIRRLGSPHADLVQKVPYPEIYPSEGEHEHPIAAGHTLFTDRFDCRSASAVLEAIESSTAAMPAAQIRPLGGRIGDIASDATAFAHRDRPIMINVAALYENPSEAEEHQKWATTLGNRLAVGKPAAYVNFLSGDADKRLREAYPEPTLTRLQAVKLRYDPENLFSTNVNYHPSVVRKSTIPE